MRNPTLSVGLSWLLIASPVRSGSSVSLRSQSANQPQVQQAPTEAPKPFVPGQFVLQDGTPVKLRLNRNVSSEDATVGESVDFEVLEEVAINGVVVIPKGGVAIGSVTEAQPKRRMARKDCVSREMRFSASEK
jgi:hypothetical protein